MTQAQVNEFWANRIVEVLSQSKRGYEFGQNIKQYMLGGFAKLVAEKKIAVDAGGNVALVASKLPLPQIA